MIISNQAVVKYRFNNKDITIKSNLFKVRLLKPIIKFFKGNYLGNIIVELINDSGITINHVFYKDLLADKSLYIKGSLKVNKKYNKGNPIIGLYLGSIKKNQRLKLQYKISTQSNQYKKALLYYCFFHNNSFNQIYTLNNTYLIEL